MFSTRVLIASILAVLAGTGVAIAAASSQKAIDNSLTIYFTSPDKFDGKVSSLEDERCVRGRPVTLKRVRPGADLKLGTKTTKDDGWVTKRIGGNARGRFYMKTPELNADFGTCVPAKSDTTTVGLGR